MRLAIQEIRHSPSRFILIVSVITLVSYLTFFLGGLANGLAHSYRASIDDWQADGVVLSEASNSNINASRLTDNQIKALPQSKDLALISTLPVVIEFGSSAKEDVFAFGLTPDSFLLPSLTQGVAPAGGSNEVVISDAMAQLGIKVGDTVQFSGVDANWSVVGVTGYQSFQALPVVYFNQKDLVAATAQTLGGSINAAVYRGQQPNSDTLVSQGLQALGTPDFINTLPGYQAQVLTFSLMIGSLIAVASFVLAIFIYVLTLQKRPILGVLKARGVPTSYLIGAGAAQTTVLSVGGVLVGLLLTLGSALILPQAVPFRLDLLMTGGIMAGFVFFAVFGGLISVRTVSRIDPVEAIS